MLNKDKVLKIAEAMSTLNQYLSFNYVALKNIPNHKFIEDITRMLREWIKQLKEIGEKDDN